MHARAVVTWRDHEQEWSPGRRVLAVGLADELARGYGLFVQMNFICNSRSEKKGLKVLA